jgi:SAM-dependent methyltransferase
MESNHEFCRDAVLALLANGASSSVKVLDYGCGAAQVVRALRAAGVEAYGTDVFYGGGSHLHALRQDQLFQSGVIRQMESDKTDFADEMFDVVFNNQVLEHVEDLDRVLNEMHRVLKPGGAVLSLFPDRGVWREGHCGIPFLHRFPKGSRLRIGYAFALRTLGLGYFKDGRTRWDWATNFCDWLDQWTFYRPLGEIHQSFERLFEDLRHVEDEYLVFRLKRSRLAQLAGPANMSWARPGARFIVRRTMGLVFTARKPLTA